MNYISNIINESRQSSEELFKKCREYSDRMSGKLPKEVSIATHLLEKYGIAEKDDIMELASSKSKANAILRKYKVGPEDADMLLQAIQTLKSNNQLRLIPMLQTDIERDDFIRAKRNMSDITMDLETEKGRNAVAKQYAGYVQSIAKKFINKSSMSLEELYSSALQGLAEAINTYRKPADEETKHLTFKQFVSWKVGQRILTDINELSRTVRRPRSEFERQKAKGGYVPTDVSIDFQVDDNDDNPYSNIEKRFGLIDYSDVYDEYPDDKKWKQIYQVVDKQFSERDANIFYRVFGINGRKQEKGIAIAKDLGISSGRVTQTVGKIINYLKEDPQTRPILRDLANLYTESLMAQMWNKDVNTVLEGFAFDPLYRTLELMTRFSDKYILESTLNEVRMRYSDDELHLLSDIITTDRIRLDNRFDESRKVIVDFLENMRPDVQFSRMNDCDIMEYVVDLATDCKNNGVTI